MAAVDRPPLLGRIFVLVVIWLGLAAIGAALWRYVIAPVRSEKLIEATSADGDLSSVVRIGLDGFSGYAVFRSAALRTRLSEAGLSLQLQDDGADYQARLRGLASGELQLALFPIDALISACARAEAMPATIILLVDESVGADALIAYRQAVPDLDTLNSANAGLVLTPGSPSETLARLARQRFDLQQLPADAWQAATGSADVLGRLQNADPAALRAYALWQPELALALQDPRLHVLLDSGQARGFIVDALVASRRFVDQHPERVVAVLRAYLQTLHRLRAEASALPELLQADAGVSAAAAEELARGIWWKATEDNYQHFGLQDPPPGQQALEALPAMLDKIIRLLRSSEAIKVDPAVGRVGRWYYPEPLAQLQAENFHPGRIGDARVFVRQTAVDWQRLRPIGTIKVPTLVFGRGNAVLTTRSQAHLQVLFEALGEWPGSLLLIRGHARPEGDAAANRRLAEARAAAVMQELLMAGVAAERLRTSVDLQAGSQTVSFVLGTAPY